MANAHSKRNGHASVMKKFLVAVATLPAVGVPTLAVATPAHADAGSPKCVTKAEWRKIKTGMTRAKVKRITGIAGKVAPYSPLIYGDGWSKDVDIEYRQCKPNGKPAPGSWNTVTMSYENYDWSIDSIENVWHPLWIEYKGGWSRPWWF